MNVRTWQLLMPGLPSSFPALQTLHEWQTFSPHIRETKGEVLRGNDPRSYAISGCAIRMETTLAVTRAE